MKTKNILFYQEQIFNLYVFNLYYSRIQAYLNGVKANIATIGLSAKVPRGYCKAGNNEPHHTHSIAKWALKAGKSIGLVTTTRGMNNKFLVLVQNHISRAFYLTLCVLFLFNFQ